MELGNAKAVALATHNTFMINERNYSPVNAGTNRAQKSCCLPCFGWFWR